MPKLSVIVPIYNVEQYLERCIESILNQTFQDFELILVDDGSPDGSPRIIDEYVNKDNRIIAFHQVNGGVSNARNNGLKHASGKYVSFIDPDDWIDNHMFQKCVSYAERNNLDIVACNIDSFYPDGTMAQHPIFFSGIMSAKEFVLHIFDKPRTIFGGVCNKLFKRSMISDCFDESLRICGDNLFLIQYCRNIQNAGVINKPFYHVFERENSAMRANPERLVDGLTVRKGIVGIMVEMDRGIGKVAEEDFLDSCIVMLNKLDGVYPLEYNVAKNIFFEYLKKNIFRVLTNDKIRLKLRIKYFMTAFGE